MASQSTRTDNVFQFGARRPGYHPGVARKIRQALDVYLFSRPLWYIIVTISTNYQEYALALVKRLRPKEGAKVKTQTYATERGAKKAARAYRPAIVRFVNGRYACFHAGQPLPQGARS